jgi:hypothetical protein
LLVPEENNQAGASNAGSERLIATTKTPSLQQDVTGSRKYLCQLQK